MFDIEKYKKVIDSKFYSFIKSNLTKPKVLTEQEFREGKPGLVYMDENYKINFDKK